MRCIELLGAQGPVVRAQAAINKWVKELRRAFQGLGHIESGVVLPTSAIRGPNVEGLGGV